MCLILIGAGLLFLTSAALADDKNQPPRPGQPPQEQIEPRRIFEQFDKNKDGFLDKDEVPERMKENFDRLDANKDGKISTDEFRRAADRPFQRRPDAAGAFPGAGDPLFRALDRNGDGKLSKDELEAAVKLLSMLDRNKDGFVDRFEVGGPAGVPGAPNPPASPDAGRRLAEMFQRLDSNNDGKISKDEAKGPLAESFDRFDQNKDGFVDKDEARRALERLMPPGGTPPSDRPRPPGDAPRAGLSFDDLDKNVDGRLNKDEVKGTPFADKFDEIDANKDGKIDPKEFEAFRAKTAPKDK
jgi:Ca2+-binding EF-hand superfamily protein